MTLLHFSSERPRAQGGPDLVPHLRCSPNQDHQARTHLPGKRVENPTKKDINSNSFFYFYCSSVRATCLSSAPCTGFPTSTSGRRSSTRRPTGSSSDRTRRRPFKRTGTTVQELTRAKKHAKNNVRETRVMSVEALNLQIFQTLQCVQFQCLRKSTTFGSKLSV